MVRYPIGDVASIDHLHGIIGNSTYEKYTDDVDTLGAYDCPDLIRFPPRQSGRYLGPSATGWSSQLRRL